MGRASLTIAISGSYNGKAVQRAEQSLERLAVKVASVNGGLGAAFVDAGGRIAEAGGQIHNVGQRMADMGDTLTRKVTLPLVATAGLAVTAATDLDTAFTNVKKTVDMDAEALDELKQNAIELSKVQPVTAEDILNAEALGGQLGIANDKLEDFARVVSGLDIATDMELEQAAMNLAQFANIVSMDQADMERYGSTIVALGNNFATTESQVSDMAMRVAAAGHQVGMSEADILGLSTALTSMGVSAEAGGTAISTIMSQIDKDVALSSDNVALWAETAGMSAEAFAAAWESDPVDALSAVLTGMDGAVESGANMAVMLDELGISSLRQTDVMKRLASNSGLLGEAVDMANKSWDENLALQAEVDNRNDSLASKFQVLANRAHAVAVEVGEPVADALLAALDAAAPLIEGVEDLARAFADADEDTQRMIVTIGGIVAAAGPALAIAGRLTKVVGGAVVGVGKAAQGMGVFASALTTTNYKAVEAYQKANTLAARLGLAGNKAVRAAGGVDSFVKAESAASKAVGDATDAIADQNTQTANLGTQTGSAAASVAKMAGAFALAVAAVAAVNAAYKELSGFNDLIEDADKARQALGDFAGMVEEVETVTPNFDLAMSTSGQSVTTLQGTVDEAMKTIATTIEENLTEAGVVTEEGAERIAAALEAAMAASAGKAEAYGASIEAYAKTAGDSLDPQAFAEYTANVSGIFEQGRTDIDDQLNQTIQAIYAKHQAMGTLNSQAYEDDIAAAQTAHAESIAELERYRDDAIRTAGTMFQELTPEMEQGWADAAAATATFDEGVRGWAATNPLYSQFARDSIEGDFARLTRDMDTGMTGAWLAAKMAAVDAGGELDEASAQNVSNILAAFEDLPDFMAEDADEAMRALAESIEAAGVDLGDTSSMSAGQITAAIRSKLGELPPAATEVSARTQANLSAGLANTRNAQAAARTLSNAVDGSLGSMAQTASARGQAVGAGVASGMNNSRGQVRGAAQSLATAQNAADASGSSYSWGSHLGANLASGIRSTFSSISSAAKSAAERVAAYLKHTTPAIGPLADDDEWGGHLIDNIAGGMRSGIPALTRAAAADAAAIERAFDPSVGFSYAKGPGLSAGASMMANRAAAEAMGSQAGSTYNFYLDGKAIPITDRVRTAVDVIFDEMERTRESYAG